MSEEKPGTEIVDYEKLLADMAKTATATERPSSSTLSFKSGIVALNGEAIKGNKISGIIIASTHANLLYEGKWDPNNPENPVCFAYAQDGEDMAPHPASEKPQSETCAKCPKNQWNSDPNGGKGKACKNIRRIAFLPDDTKVEEVPTMEIAVAALPTTSVKNWSNYVNLVSTMFSRPPLGMVTEIGVEPHLKHQYHVTFTAKGVIDIGMIRALMERAKTPAVIELLHKAYDPNVEKPAEPVRADGKKDKM